MIKLAFFVMACWGILNISINKRTVLSYAQEWLEKQDLPIEEMTLEKLKAIFPSWTKKSHQVFEEKLKKTFE